MRQRARLLLENPNPAFFGRALLQRQATFLALEACLLASCISTCTPATKITTPLDLVNNNTPASSIIEGIQHPTNTMLQP